jgi:hypothetical protein
MLVQSIPTNSREGQVSNPVSPTMKIRRLTSIVSAFFYVVYTLVYTNLYVFKFSLKTYRFKTTHRINLFNVSILNASNRVATRSGVGAYVGVAVTEA